MRQLRRWLQGLQPLDHWKRDEPRLRVAGPERACRLRITVQLRGLLPSLVPRDQGRAARRLGDLTGPRSLRWALLGRLLRILHP